MSCSASAVECNNEVKFCKNLNIVPGALPLDPLRHKSSSQEQKSSGLNLLLPLQRPFDTDIFHNQLQVGQDFGLVAVVVALDSLVGSR